MTARTGMHRRRFAQVSICWMACGYLAAQTVGAQNRVMRLSMMDQVPTITVKPLATLQKAYRNLGFELEIEAMPYARSLLVADRGEVDGEVARLPHIEESAKNLRRVPVPVNVTEYVPYVLRGTRADLSSWDKINASGLRVGARYGARLTEDSIRKDRLTLVNTYESLVNMLLLKRVDVVIAPRGQLEDVFPNIDERSKDELVRIQALPVFASVPVYHYLHVRHEALIPRLAEEIKRVQAEEGLAQQRAKKASKQKQ